MSEIKDRTLYVLGAFEPELEPLRRRLTDREGLSGLNRCRLKFAETGIGSVLSAAVVTDLVLTAREAGESPSFLFIGSAGSVKTDSSFDFLSVESISFADSAIASGKAYLPIAAPIRIDAYSEKAEKALSVLRAKSVSIGAVHVYSSPSITANSELASLLSLRSGAHYENLELFGIAVAASRLGTPWNAICPVTNVVGPGGHEEWKRNFEIQSALLAENLTPEFFKAVWPELYFSPLS